MAQSRATVQARLNQGPKCRLAFLDNGKQVCKVTNLFKSEIINLDTKAAFFCVTCKAAWVPVLNAAMAFVMTLLLILRPT